MLSLYARGVSVREIQGHVEQRYQVEVSPAVISAVTDAVLEEVTAWQQRPLERVYPVVIFDARRVKIRVEGVVRNTAIYSANTDPRRPPASPESGTPPALWRRATA